MNRKERWYSSIVLLVSVLPLLFLGILQGITNGPYIFVDTTNDVVYELTEYQIDFIGLFCFVPAIILAIARFVRGKGMLVKHFTVIVTAVLVLCLAYFVAIVIIVWRTLSSLTLSDVVVKINYGSFACTALCLVFCVLGNIMPELKPNPIFGINNRYTTENKAVWEKVNSVASSVIMYVFLASSVMTSFASNVVAVVLLVVAILVYYGWVYFYSRRVYKNFSGGGKVSSCKKKRY